MLSARFLLLPHAFPPPHLRFHGAFVQWIDVTQAPSEYFRRKAAVSDLGSVIASQLASPKVRISSHGLPSVSGRLSVIESPPGAVRLT